MYNIYGTSSGQENYGSFKLEYSDPPLNFEPGSKMALLNLMTWNNIYNISAERGNNVIYILDKNTTITSSSQHDNYAPIDDSHDVDSVSIALSTASTGFSNPVLNKIVLPDGQYSIEALDREIAIRLGVDLTTNNSDVGNELTLMAQENRIFWLEANETYNKIDFHYDEDRFDILYPTSGITENSILHFMGLQKIMTTTPVQYAYRSTTTENPAYFRGYSLNTYINAQPGTGTQYSRLAPSIADVNNGMTSMNLRLRNGVINGGMESNHGGPSDILYSFNITTAPGYPQNDSPPNLVWLDITATNTPINELFFEYTDQNGTPLNHNMADESSFTLVIKGPEEDLSAAVSNLTAVINNISMGDK